IEAAVQLAADDAKRHELGGNAARAMKRLHPQQVLAAGFDGFLRKPVTGDLLVTAIAQARAKRQATA
ncbi:hypothetical protein C7E18_08135, partial [Stenotrophomonas maltophilia]